jgi:protein-tyrosine phosphatase
VDITPLYTRLLLGSAPASGPRLAQLGVQVLVLCAEEYQPRSKDFPGVIVLHAPMSDDANPDNFDVALQAAERVKREWSRGRTVLITCLMGRNRSALVAALALVLMTSLPARDVVDHIRSLRKDPVGVRALSNPHFIAFLNQIDRTQRQSA